MSVYAGDRTKKGLADAIAKIETAFPGWSAEQSKVLKDRFADNGFSDQRMIDAVNHVIDTCTYPIPSVAEFIRFDKRVKVLTYSEITKAQYDGTLSWDDYTAIDVGLDKPRWAKSEDVVRYRLTKWESKQ